MLSSQEELSKILGFLYDAAADPSLWHPFIEQLGRHTEATGAALVIHDLDHVLCGVSGTWELDPDVTRLYQEHYFASDVWAEKLSGQRSGSVYISESLCPLAELRTTDFYNELLAKAGIEHAMFAIPENSKSCLASLSIYRNRSRREFTRRDLGLLELLAPHLQRAFKLHFVLSEARAHSAGVEAALEMLPTGIVLLGSKGEIIFMNRSATALVGEQDGLLATRDGLRAERSTESTLLVSAIQQAASTSTRQGTSAGGTLLVSRRTRPPLHILVSPIHDLILKSSQRIAAVAFINDPLRPQRPAEAVLRTLYGLTPAECRVALLLSDGRAPREIAELIGVADNTVRSQIKSIFSKTGVRRQGELIRLLLNDAGPEFSRPRRPEN